jgi:hypothetical protein
MSTDLTLPPESGGAPEAFDYGDFEDEAAAELRAIAERCRVHMRRSVADMIAIGHELRRVRDEYLEEREFAPWLRAELEIPRSTAYNFISVADRFGEHLSNIGHIPAGVLIELARKSTPAELVEGVLSGDLEPTAAAVRQARAEHRGEAPSRERHAYPSLEQRLKRMAPERRADTLLGALETLAATTTVAAALIAAAAARRYGDAAAKRLEPLAKVLAAAQERVREGAAA